MNLTIEQMRKIVDEAPREATHYSDDDCDIVYYWKTDNVIYWDDMLELKPLSDLRAAIADNDRTDYVSDIRNHISPMTIVQGDS